MVLVPVFLQGCGPQYSSKFSETLFCPQTKPFCMQIKESSSGRIPKFSIILFSPERCSKVVKMAKTDRLDTLIVLARDVQFSFFPWKWSKGGDQWMIFCWMKPYNFAGFLLVRVICIHRHIFFCSCIICTLMMLMFFFSSLFLVFYPCSLYIHMCQSIVQVFYKLCFILVHPYTSWGSLVKSLLEMWIL